MSKNKNEQTLMEFLKQEGLEDKLKEFQQKKEEEENDPNIMTVKQVSEELQKHFKDGKWNLQKVRRYIRDNKIEAMNKEIVEKEKNSRIGYRVDRKKFNAFVAFEQKTKWDLKIEVDKLLDYNDELKEVINNLKDEIKTLKAEKETK